MVHHKCVLIVMAWISLSSRTNNAYFLFLDYWASWITWKIDLCGMYNLVHLWGGDELKIEFQTHYGYFEHVVMPFSFINAFAFFQHLMHVFHEYLDDFVVYYIDDIFIFSKNMKDHEHQDMKDHEHQDMKDHEGEYVLL